MPIEIRLSKASQADLRRVAKLLRANGNPKAIRRELIRGLRAGTKPVLADTKSAARGLPAGGGKSTGLRKRIAAAASIAVRTGGKSAGVKIRIPRKRLGDQGVLPQRMNKGRWRHPVYGTDVWVEQTSRANWFDNSGRKGRPSVRRALKRVLDDIERKLSK